VEPPEIRLQIDNLRSRDVEARKNAAKKLGIADLSDWPTRIRDFFDKNKTGPVGEAVSFDESLPFMPIREPLEEDWQEYGSKLVEHFMPHIDGRGMELWADTKQLFLGLQSRVLIDPKDKSRRCIQYIYLWSMQRRPISIFYSTIFFLMLASLVFVRGQSAFFYTWNWSSWLLVGSALCFSAYGAYRYVRPIACFKNHLWYLLGGLLLLFSVWGQIVSRNPIPYGFWTLTICAVVLLLISQGLKSRFLQHVMDYGPVFLYLKRRRAVENPKPEDWDIESVRYDKHHYSLAYAHGANLKRSLSDDKKTVFFRIDNVWHSFELDKPHRHKEPVTLWVQTQVTVLLVLFAATLGLMPVVYAFPSYSDVCLVVGVALTGLVAFLNWFVRIPVRSEEEHSKLFLSTKDLVRLWGMSRTKIGSATVDSKPFLSIQKLVRLWNMNSEEARFKVRMKLQEPFAREGDLEHWKDFYDPPPLELVYEAFREIIALRKTVAGTAQLA
jgi:hypothetical protein